MIKFKIFNILVTLVYRLIIYAAVLTPLGFYLSKIRELNQNEIYLYFLLSCFISLLILILLPSCIICCLPKLKIGQFKIGSGQFFLSLVHDSFREVHSSSAFITGIINRVEFLRLIVYRLYGSEVNGYFSLSHNTRLLSPSLMTFEKNSYIALDCLISCHSIKKGSFWAYPFSIGANSVIGADCKIACGAEIGHHSYLDTGVKLSFRAKIGNNVKILSYSEINDNLIIGDRSIIGKVCKINSEVTIGTRSLIGEASQIDNHVFIGNNTVVGNFSIIRHGAKIGNNVKLCEFAYVPENCIIQDNEVYTRTWVK